VSTENVETQSRQQRKERTRQAILDTALELSTKEPLAALSLRTIAKEVGIVPTAFYRHFSSIEELGVALSEISVAELRKLLTEIRNQTQTSPEPLKATITAILNGYENQPALYSFLVRERICGPALVREHINHDLQLVAREVATDLARLPRLRTWSTEDLTTLADLLLTQALNAIERFNTNSPREALLTSLEKQARMLVVGTQNWDSA
jgi:AcrR family transcriptional regulator